jgi:hypothetical protein
MHHAEACGLKTVADDLDRMADMLGDEELRPARLLRELAKAGGSLAEVGGGAD